MAKQMKSFRASEDTQYMLNRYSERLDVSQSDLIEMALEWFAGSGALDAVADLKHLSKYQTFPDFEYLACHDGKVRELVRRNNGLGIEPITI